MFSKATRKVRPGQNGNVRSPGGRGKLILGLIRSDWLKWQSSLDRSHCVMTHLGYWDVVPQFQSLISLQFLLFMFHSFSFNPIPYPIFNHFLFLSQNFFLSLGFSPNQFLLFFCSSHGIGYIYLLLVVTFFPNSYSIWSQLLVSPQGPRESFFMQHLKNKINLIFTMGFLLLTKLYHCHCFLQNPRCPKIIK